MITICDKCSFEFEYDNFYGTRCRKCDSYIAPAKKPEFIEKQEKKIEELRSAFRCGLRMTLKEQE